MPISRRYQCPECEGAFTFLHMTKDEPPPSYCSLCGAFVGEDPQPMVSAPNIITNKSKGVDQTYRQMEESSAYRAEMAGSPALKMTDMQDNLRAGDVSAKMVRNLVTDVADSAEGFSYFQGASVASVAAQAKAGPDAKSTGAGALAAIQSVGAPVRAPTNSLIQPSWGGGQ